MHIITHHFLNNTKQCVYQTAINAIPQINIHTTWLAQTRLNCGLMSVLRLDWPKLKCKDRGCLTPQLFTSYLCISQIDSDLRDP